MTLKLGDMLSASALKLPEKEVIAYGDWRLNYRTLEQRANKIANSLLSLGLEKGNRCAVLLYNRGEWGEIYFGLAKTGIIAVPINFRFTATEVEYVLSNSEPKALIYEEEFVPIIEEIRGKITSLGHYIRIGEKSGPDLEYEKLLSQSSDRLPRLEVDENDPLIISYTSGTTGFPKGAVIPHKKMVSHYLLLTKEFGRLSRHDRMLLIMPIFHINSTWFLHSMAMMGGSIVVYKSGKFDPEEVLSIIDKEKITATSVVPTMLTMILNLPPEKKNSYSMGSFRVCLVGSAPLLSKTKEETLDFFKDTDLYEGYGSTETGVVTILEPEEQLRKVRSIGLPTPGKEVMLLDENYKEVKQGEVGELYARGVGILIEEYWKNPQATSDGYYEDFFSVGDMAMQDEDGYYYLVDRKKDMIISGGENIYPTEVENVLSKHPAVLESAVIGIHDELWGERVHAVVALKEGSSATKDELIEFCRDKVAGYKRPRSIDFAQSLPKSATGKILRKAVRQDYDEGL